MALPSLSCPGKPAPIRRAECEVFSGAAASLQKKIPWVTHRGMLECRSHLCSCTLKLYSSAQRALSAQKGLRMVLQCSTNTQKPANAITRIQQRKWNLCHTSRQIHELQACHRTLTRHYTKTFTPPYIKKKPRPLKPSFALHKNAFIPQTSRRIRENHAERLSPPSYTEMLWHRAEPN